MEPTVENCKQILEMSPITGWRLGYPTSQKPSVSLVCVHVCFFICRKSKVFLKYYHVDSLAERLGQIGRHVVHVQKGETRDRMPQYCSSTPQERPSVLLQWFAVSWVVASRVDVERSPSRSDLPCSSLSAMWLIIQRLCTLHQLNTCQLDKKIPEKWKFKKKNPEKLWSIFQCSLLVLRLLQERSFASATCSTCTRVVTKVVVLGTSCSASVAGTMLLNRSTIWTWHLIACSCLIPSLTSSWSAWRNSIRFQKVRATTTTKTTSRRRRCSPCHRSASDRKERGRRRCAGSRRRNCRACARRVAAALRSGFTESFLDGELHLTRTCLCHASVRFMDTSTSSVHCLLYNAVMLSACWKVNRSAASWFESVSRASATLSPSGANHHPRAFVHLTIV